ncbi:MULTISPECIES: NADH-quinone oxidoreductase subunit NuoN [unclassified Modicisalibacter]|uniref:NADH-quinone oxidoreductase subunit NuoN n=1 Tax=unclassified Modicisalibacter TaxID=2679913 RepID=UPI001CCFB18B|nr:MULTISPECIES: NADH-quinone oxidoreductase subunit NuoN [unclassified Modicisalibacter]MBZ9558860.1 NADH-quinone oxidoreductase subunit NuoN [Modicisalibacter sp. R2A 31.J]MBZ9575248.1 NADH-quinone oxidoreductase subunit NuoN [Modicisalibacter sp. MOD 31.J]
MTLTATHLLALAPLILVCATAIVVMLGIAWRRHHTGSAIVTVVGLNLALLSLFGVWQLAPLETPMLAIDGLAILAAALILIAALACATLAHAYLEQFDDQREEFYLLLLCSTAGGLVLSASTHLATLFFGLELVSMPLYGMLAYTYRARRSLEAGIKYLVLSAAATTFLLFGMALLYAETGHLDIAGLADSAAGGIGAWGLAGAAMVIVGLGFKLSVVPFHLWTPDVYEGGPGPATTFLASASKVAVFAVLLRLVMSAPAFQSDWLHGVLAVLAVVTMLVGNLLAVTQSNLKRLLGYSSIAHFGYLLTALVIGEGLSIEATGVYLVTYMLTTLGAFGVVTLISSPYSGEDAAALHHYRGLFWRRPYLTAVLTITMLSMAGIPFTAGFIGKFYIIALGVEAGRWWLVGAVIVGSAIGLYYYLRVMVTLYLAEAGMQRRDAPENWAIQAGGLMVLGAAVLVILLGIYPAPMIDWVRVMSSAMLGVG